MKTDKKNQTNVLFFLHIPKCAGMSLTDALLDRLPANEVYQSTSMIRNVKENRPEFLQIMNHNRLKAVVGHWVHEGMLPLLKKPILFASSIRDPIARMRSQYRFDVGIRKGSWNKTDPRRCLEDNRNTIVNFVVRAFPSVAKDFDDPVQGCKAVLSGMDMLFDVSDADKRIHELVKAVSSDGPKVARTNESGGIEVDLPFSDEEIAEYCQLDLKVYEWFSEAKSHHSMARNPVFDAGVRKQFASLGAKPFQPEPLASYLAKFLAMEVHFGAFRVDEISDLLAANRAFTERLEQNLRQLRAQKKL